LKNPRAARLASYIRGWEDRVAYDETPRCIDAAMLQKWLKAGYMKKGVFHETTDGTPQEAGTALSVTDLLCERAPFSWQLFRPVSKPSGF
jgi:hypothetical protein